MALEFIEQMQFVSATPGAIQPNGVQPVALSFASVISPMTLVVNTDLSDPLNNLTGTVWLRLDDTNPNVAIPTLGTTVSESTAPVITATVEQIDNPVAV